MFNDINLCTVDFMTDSRINKSVIVRGSQVYVTTALHTYDKKARVMAVAEKYAMVRYPRCMPFVVSVEDLEL